ncbi:MAG: hypothetical protein KBD76_01710 [Bacteriovorax sp.]|nr:hypothetical protein [Bacteriovorax sp.]
MSVIKWELFLLTLFVCESCSTSGVDELSSVSEEHEKKIIPSKTFNQLHNEWDY